MTRTRRLLALAVTAAVIGGGLGLATASGGSNAPAKKAPAVKQHHTPRAHHAKSHYCPFQQGSDASTATDF
jgi:hypothetical protein